MQLVDRAKLPRTRIGRAARAPNSGGCYIYRSLKLGKQNHRQPRSVHTVEELSPSHLVPSDLNTFYVRAWSTKNLCYRTFNQCQLFFGLLYRFVVMIEKMSVPIMAKNYSHCPLKKRPVHIIESEGNYHSVYKLLHFTRVLFLIFIVFILYKFEINILFFSFSRTWKPEYKTGRSQHYRPLY